VLAGHGVFPFNAMRGVWFFHLAVLSLAVAVGLLLIKLSIWLLVPLVVGVSLIVVLNHRLYGFFARKRGVTFAIAVIPFQLLYYFYSVLSLAMGTILHSWGIEGRQWFWVPPSVRMHLASQLSRS
jgi:hypothetical protein